MPSLGHISIEFNGYLGNFRKDGQIKISVGKKTAAKSHSWFESNQLVCFHDQFTKRPLDLQALMQLQIVAKIQFVNKQIAL